MIVDLAIQFVSLLAQETPAAPGGGGGGQPLQPAPSFVQVLVQMAPIIIIFIVFFWLMGSARRKQEKERQALLASLKKGDRVRMAGGELGSIVEVRDTEVLVKVDESSNTKITYTRDAVAAVIKEK